LCQRQLQTLVLLDFIVLVLPLLLSHVLLGLSAQALSLALPVLALSDCIAQLEQQPRQQPRLRQ